MKKRFAKVVSTIMAAALVFSFGATALAAEPPHATPRGAPPYAKRVKITSWGDQSQVLNMYTSGTPASGTNVTTWQSDGSDTQRWWIQPVNIGNREYYVRPTDTSPLGLNIARDQGNNCNLYPIVGNARDDSVITIVDESASKGANTYGFVLLSHMLAMTKTSTRYAISSGAYGYEVNWQAPVDSSGQYWIITVA